MSEKASKNVSVSAAGAANSAPSRPIKLEKITASGIRKNICLESDITRAFTKYLIKETKSVFMEEITR